MSDDGGADGSPAAGSLPVVDPPGTEAVAGGPRADATVAGVLLAAGDSDRFGEANKLLAGLDGEPLVAHAAGTLTGAGLDGVVAVVGHEADRVRDALGEYPLDVVENPDYEQGQATTVGAGVRAVGDAGVDAAVFALGDMPRVRTGTVEALVAAFRAGLGDPLAAAHDGRRGNPVLFGARYFEALADVEGDTGGRQLLLGSDDAALVETGDPGVRADVDTPADLDALRGG